MTSAEYPYYVLADSVYNDWWYLEVTAATNGARLFRRLRQVNSQLTQEPIWQLNGTTATFSTSSTRRPSHSTAPPT